MHTNFIGSIPGLLQRAGRTALFVLALLFAGTGTVAFGQTLPIGFADEVVTSGLNLPTAFTVLPDGRLLVTEKQGLVRVISNGTLLAAPFIDLRSVVNDYWDRGLIGIAADANFATNGFVYLLHTYENDASDYSGSKTARMIRVTATGNVASPSSVVVILGTSVGRSCNDFAVGADCIPSDYASHTVGNVKVASDGTLFLTVGDGASFNVVNDDALRAQQLDSLGGKVLHVTTSGKGVSGNPFWNGDANANRSKVWASGLRNPYRLALAPGSNVPYVGDVGWGLWEEVNAATPGANFGWPCYEGPTPQPGYEPYPVCQALYAAGPNAVQFGAAPYFHSMGGSAVTAGTFYNGTAFPAQYRGAFFYADYAVGFLRYFSVDASGAKAGPVTGFGIDLNGPVYLDTDGQHLLYLSVISGELRRVRYTGASPEISYLSDRSWTSMTNAWGPLQRDQSNGEDSDADGRILTLNGSGYPKGLGGHAPADVRFALNGACSVFAASVGVDDEVDGNVDVPRTIVFQAFADGVKIFDSGVMNPGSATQNVNVSVSGRNELRLVMLDAGDGNGGDHGDWGNARVSCTSADTTPPTVTAIGPGDGAANVQVDVNVTGTFSEAMTASTLTGATVSLRQGTTQVPAAVVYDPGSRTVTLNPTADLAGSTTYTATIKGGASGVKDAAGNPLGADRVWTFTTIATGTTVSFLSDRSWTTVANGWGPVEKDRSNAEQPANDGGPLRLNGVTYAKGLGVHAASEVRFALGGACSAMTALVGIDDEVGAAGSAIFQVFADGAATPLFDSGVMTGTTATKTVSVNLAGVNTLRLVVAMGPDGNSSDHADWADAKVTCSLGGDTTAPTVTSVNPSAGASNVVVNANVTGTFSEAMNAGTLTTATVTLTAGSTAIPAAVTYSAANNTVTLDPNADLTGNTVYTATIKGGASGAKDIAGNPLANDRIWTFTVGAGGTTVTYLSDRAWTQIANGWGPAEKDRSNNQDGANDGGTLTLEGVTYGKGIGAHAASDLRFTLGGACSLLSAQVGIDDEVGAEGSAIFQIFADSAVTPLFDSGVMTGTTPTKTVSVNLGGVNTLRLVVDMGPDGNSYDHADWADARLTCSSGGDVIAPTVTTVTPASGSVGTALNANITAVFSEPMGPATISTSTVTLVAQGSGTALAATVTYAAATNTVTLDPTAALMPNTLYTATIKGGASGVKDVAGNSLATDRVWSFRTNVPPTPTISQPTTTTKFKVGDVITYSGSASDPEDGALPSSSLSWNVVLQHCPSGQCHAHPFTNSTGTGGTFTAPDHGDDSYFDIALTATDSAGLTTTTTLTIQPQTVLITLNTSPAGLQVIYGGTVATAPATFTTIANSLHTIQVSSPQGGLTFANWSDGGAQQHNVLVGTANVTYTATFTGGGGGTTTTFLSDRAWTTVANGWGPVEKDRSNAEDAAGDGAPLRLNGVVYAKGLGVHALSDVRFALGGVCSQMTAQVGIDDEVGDNGSVIFQVFADSASSPLFDSGVMTGASATKSVSVNITGVNTLRLVAGVGPDGNSYDHADWADAKVTCGTGGDTTAPTVTTFTPSAGATGVPVNTNITATFSEAMASATLTGTSVILARQDTGATIGAAVIYSPASNTVTLDPTADLTGSTVYTATIKGGAAGAKDLAGNPLASDRVWTFTTAGSGTTITYLSDRPWTEVANGWGPVEKDRSNGQTGPTDGGTLTLNGVSYAKGLGAHGASDIRFALGGACSAFTADIGIDDEVPADGSAIFEVYADAAATPIYNSGVMTATTATKKVSLNIAGVNTLRLVVAMGPDGNSYDHADWADAKITCSGLAPASTNDAASSASADLAPPATPAGAR